MCELFKKQKLLLGILLFSLLVSCQEEFVENTQEVEVTEFDIRGEDKAVAIRPFRIIAQSDPTETTHTLSSGNTGDKFVLGITNRGGGIINRMIVPGLAGNRDIMGAQTDMYGRAGQVAIRDQSHSGKYNPTQAGHDEELGTRCVVTKVPGKLTVEPRGMALWHGDGQYDFTRWENVGEDAYPDSVPNRFGYTDNGNSDVDPLNEENLPGKMSTEVFSEFDYFGTYEDWFGRRGINAAVIRHYYQLSYIRPPGHCINQFNRNSIVWNPNKVSSDISNRNPAGVHRGTDKDLSGMIGVWSIRNDSEIWLPTHVYYRTPAGEWRSTRASNVQDNFDNIPGTDKEIFIYTNGTNENNSRGICLYRPNSDINVNSIIGINENMGAIVYKDNRFDTRLQYSLRRTPTLAKFGFISSNGGMINRTRLARNVYEAYRNEVFILYGSPRQIMNSVRIIDGILNRR